MHSFHLKLHTPCPWPWSMCVCLCCGTHSLTWANRWEATVSQISASSVATAWGLGLSVVLNATQGSVKLLLPLQTLLKTIRKNPSADPSHVFCDVQALYYGEAQHTGTETDRSYTKNRPVTTKNDKQQQDGTKYRIQFGLVLSKLTQKRVLCFHCPVWHSHTLVPLRLSLMC